MATTSSASSPSLAASRSTGSRAPMLLRCVSASAIASSLPAGAARESPNTTSPSRPSAMMTSLSSIPSPPCSPRRATPRCGVSISTPATVSSKPSSPFASPTPPSYTPSFESSAPSKASKTSKGNDKPAFPAITYYTKSY